MWRSFLISKVDAWLILLIRNEGFGGFVGFEADRLRDRILSTEHKDFGAAEVGILCTQRMSRGRDRDFIYATNAARPGSDFYLHKR